MQDPASTAHRERERRLHRGAEWAVACAIAATFFVWMQGFQPFDRPLSRDSATWTYMSLETARGMVPHRDIFLHKTPGAALLGAAAARLGMGFGEATDRGLHAIVASFLLVAALAPALLFLLCRPRLGWIGAVAAAACMVAYDQWPVAAYEVVRPKVAMVSLGLGALLAAERARPFASGLLASASVLCWQPGLCFVAGSAWALRSSAAAGPDHRRLSQTWARFLAGCLIPALALLAWLAVAGGLADFVDQAVLFNLDYIELKAAPPATTLIRLLRMLRHWGGTESLLALVALPGLFSAGARLPGSLVCAGTLYVTMVFVSLQAWPDTLPLLPLLSAATVSGILALGRTVRLPRATALGLLGVALWTASQPANPRLFPRVTLAEQAEFYRSLAAGVSADDPVIAISLPEFLVHNRRRSAWKFPYMWNGVDRFAASSVGGFSALLAELDRIDPALIVLGRRWTGRGRRLFEKWARTRFSRSETKYYPYSWPIVVFRRLPAVTRESGFRTRPSGRGSPQIPRSHRSPSRGAAPAPTGSVPHSNS